MKGLEKVVAEINKVYGEGTLMRASDASALVLDRFTTGIFDLDMKLGGGYPRGRIIMFKGGYSTGKSAVAMLGVASAQRSCRFCGGLFEHIDSQGEVHKMNCKCGKKEPMRVVWMDVEHTFDRSWAEKWGIDTENLYVIQTESAEEAVNIAEKCVRSKECDFLVVDSVAALSPITEVENESGSSNMGVFARLMNQALRKWTSGMNSGSLLDTTKCTIVLINQDRLAIGGFRPMLASPGGEGLKFFTSVTVRFKRKDTLRSPNIDRPVGIETEFLVEKNKTAPLMDGGLFNLYFVSDRSGYKAGETNNAEQVLRLATYWKLVEYKKPWINFPDGAKYQGVTNASAYLLENPEFCKELEIEIRRLELAWQETGDCDE